MTNQIQNYLIMYSWANWYKLRRLSAFFSPQNQKLTHQWVYTPNFSHFQAAILSKSFLEADHSMQNHTSEKTKKIKSIANRTHSLRQKHEPPTTGQIKRKTLFPIYTNIFTYHCTVPFHNKFHDIFHNKT